MRNQSEAVSQRRSVVLELMQQGKPFADVVSDVAARGILNPQTSKPYSAATIRADMRTMRVVSEIIGRDSSTMYGFWRSYGAVNALDRTRADYRFWDELRRGLSYGLELGGLFCQPIVQIIASFVLGTGVKLLVEDEAKSASGVYTNGLLQRWINRSMALLLRLLEDDYALGDQFVIVNADGSLSIPSPDTVTVEYDRLDYRRMVKCTVETVMSGVTIRDEYREDGRTLTITNNTGQPLPTEDGQLIAPGQKAERTFENLIGRIPVVHFANDRSVNEVFGRPIYEALYRLFSRYDTLLEKALDGAEIMGNPIPTFAGMEDIQGTIDANDTARDETYYDPDGIRETRKTIKFDGNAAIFVGKGGSFNFVAPPTGFTRDIRDILKSLFLLMMDHTRIPEFLWGGAIASSKASAEVQMPPFLQYVEGRRLQFEGEGADEQSGAQARGGLLELADIWLRFRALTDPQVMVAPVRAQWSRLTETGEAMRLEYLKWARTQERLITAQDALSSAAIVLGIDDPEDAHQRAEAEAQDARDNDPSQQIARLALRRDPDEGEDDEGEQLFSRNGNGNGRLARVS